MADVTPRGGGLERAQLLIITGLVIAITLVALTLLLNTVIFSDNLAARGTGFGADDAVEYRATTEIAVGMLIDLETDQEHDDYESLNASVREVIDEYVRVRSLQTAHRGVSVWMENLALTEGERLRQTDPDRAFTNRTGTGKWTLAENVTQTRQFVLNVTSANGTLEDDAFAVVLNDSEDAWWVFVYEADGNVTIAVQNGTDTTPTEDVCNPSQAPVIDLTAGTVDGNPCDALVFANEIQTPYSIAYEHGGNVTGTYNLTIKIEDSVNVTHDNFADTIGDDPYTIPAVYSASFDVGYESRILEYQATSRVAVGEP